VKLTETPGAIPIESYDGRDLYYVEAAERPSSLWRLPLAGGAPVKVLDGVANGAYDLVERGVYYIERVAALPATTPSDRPGADARLQFFDFATGRITTVADNPGPPAPGLTASRDGRTIVIPRIDSAVDELMLVENFR
jgi:hypothetical protein